MAGTAACGDSVEPSPTLPEAQYVPGELLAELAPGVADSTAARRLPPDGTASMRRDIMQGRPSELESQVGAVVRLGDRLGLAVPLHR